jgi:hypothetical protein
MGKELTAKPLIAKTEYGLPGRKTGRRTKEKERIPWPVLQASTSRPTSAF